jgi:hypothetical protein
MLPVALYECLPFVCLLIGAFAWIAPAPLIVRTLSTLLFLIGAYVLWLRLLKRRSGPR